MARWRWSATACLLTACALFPSLGDLDESDASFDASVDAQTSDATSDVDASKPIDAAKPDGGDASTTLDGSGFCANHLDASFCSDFDDGKALTVVWTTPETSPTDASVVFVDSDSSTSPPSSFVAQTPTTANGVVVKADVLAQVTATATSSVHVEFDFLLEANDTTNGGMFFMALRIGNGSDPQKYILTLHTSTNAKAQLEEQGPDDGGAQETTLSVAPVLGTWSHIALDVDLVGLGVSVLVDGKQALGPQPPKTAIATGGVSLRAGITYSQGPHPLLRARFDNVLAYVN